MDMLEDAGIIGPQSGAGPRQIVMDQQQLLEIFNGSGSAENAADAAPAETTTSVNTESTMEENA